MSVKNNSAIDTQIKRLKKKLVWRSVMKSVNIVYKTAMCEEWEFKKCLVRYKIILNVSPLEPQKFRT